MEYPHHNILTEINGKIINRHPDSFFFGSKNFNCSFAHNNVMNKKQMQKILNANRVYSDAQII